MTRSFRSCLRLCAPLSLLLLLALGACSYSTTAVELPWPNGFKTIEQTAKTIDPTQIDTATTYAQDCGPATSVPPELLTAGVWIEGENGIACRAHNDAHSSQRGVIGVAVESVAPAALIGWGMSQSGSRSDTTIVDGATAATAASTIVRDRVPHGHGGETGRAPGAETPTPAQAPKAPPAPVVPPTAPVAAVPPPAHVHPWSDGVHQTYVPASKHSGWQRRGSTTPHEPPVAVAPPPVHAAPWQPPTRTQPPVPHEDGNWQRRGSTTPHEPPVAVAPPPVHAAPWQPAHTGKPEPMELGDHTRSESASPAPPRDRGGNSGHHSPEGGDKPIDL